MSDPTTKQGADFDPVASLAAMRHEFGEHGGVNMSIEASTTYTVLSPETMPDIFQGSRGPEQGCYLYGRHFNPTVYVLGKQLAALEGTEAAYCASSGMGAIASTLLQLVERGDHIIASRAVYGGTFALLNSYLPKRTGVETTFVDITDLEAIEAAFVQERDRAGHSSEKTGRTPVLFTETMSNPTLVVGDLSALAEIAHRHGARLVVDNTFCPIVVSPAQHGADIVVHSLTKFVSGASDIIAGAVCADREFIASLMDLHDGSLMLLGPTLDPKTAFELSLRIPHLGLRMSEHSCRAQLFSERIEALGVPVIYPGLASHPQHALLEKLANPGYGFGGIFAIDLGTAETANSFVSHLQNQDHFGFIAVSLGFFETLVSCSATSTSSELGPEALAEAGISPGLVRVSIGYTGDPEQRWAQMEAALHGVGLDRIRGSSQGNRTSREARHECGTTNSS